MEKDNFRMGYLVLVSDTPSFRASPALFYQPLSSYGKILKSMLPIFNHSTRLSFKSSLLQTTHL